jgi:PAS domain S-box-containing protein
MQFLGRQYSTRTITAALVLAILAPVLLFSGILLTRYAAAEQARLETDVIERARDIAQDIDRDIAGLQAAIQALATSRLLQSGDLPEFYRQASEVRAFVGVDVVLRELGGQQIVNTRIPWGEPLPRVTLETDRDMVARGDPSVSDVFVGATANRPIFIVAAPVKRHGAVTHLLSLGVETDRLIGIVSDKLPDGWTSLAVDRKNVIVARSSRHDVLTGQLAMDVALDRAAGDSGSYVASSADGQPMLVGYARSRLTGWRTVVSAPQALIQQPSRRSVEALALMGATALGLSLLLGLGFSRRVTQPLQQLVASAAALGRSEPVAPVRTQLLEVDKVAEALADASVRLRSKAQQRDAAEAALRSSEARQRLIVDSATDYAIITADLDGRVTSWSTGAEEVLGWSRDEAIGRHVALVFTAEDRAAGLPESELATALATGATTDDRWHSRKDGTRFFASGRTQPMRDENGAAIGFLTIMRDRTQERQAEEAMRELAHLLEARVEERTAALTEANRQLIAEMQRREATESQLRQMQKMEAVGQLTGGIAHDFNNMLAVVIGSLSMMQKRMARGETDVARYIESAMDGASRAATLTKRLLAFSRQQALAPEVLDANRMVEGMSEMLRRTLGGGIRLQIALAGELWLTHADPGQLENALLNLAVNARDAMPDGGHLRIETDNVRLDDAGAKGDYVQILVADSGSGMPPDVVAKAFDPFFTTKPAGRGTGLGLSQVYGFVRQSGGQVRIDSTPGEGTLVRIHLPRFAGARPSPSRVVLADRPADVPQGRAEEVVLVVEDEERVRQFAVEALRELGYTVIDAGSALDGLRQLDTHPEVSLLFTDVVMPDVNGRRLADEALRRSPNLKVLFTTGYTRDAVVRNGVLDAGVHLITKPFTVAELASRVRAVIDGPMA